MDQQHPSTPKGRGVRSHSFRSDRSGGSKGRNDIIESPKEKEMRERLWSSKSKANPNAAITEAQPGDIARLEEATIAPLRGHTYKDANGNPILDPDLSNPTRPRLERPLDTIRLHEQRIEDGYKRRSTYGRTETTYAENQQYASKRNSYFGVDGNNNGGPRPLQAGTGTHGPQSTSTRRHHTPRMQSDPNTSYPNRPYGHHTYHQSQNTMNTDLTNGSDSTGPWASHTDPSSENSSIDKPNGGHRSQQHDSHNNNYGSYSQNGQGYSGYANGTGVRASIPEERASGNYYAGPPPAASPEIQRRPIPLNKSSGGPILAPRADLPVPPRPETAKRGSWIKRTFSKRG